MKLSAITLLLGFVMAGNARAQEIHTPKVSSPERQAICDAARSFVIGKYATGKLPQPIVFKIGHFLVSGDFANFEAIPLFKDGSYVDTNFLPDIGYNFCLRKNGGVWSVVADLSRSDVPDADELATIRRNLAEFPRALLSPDWRRLLGD
jgi:hypothetical protein